MVFFNVTSIYFGLFTIFFISSDTFLFNLGVSDIILGSLPSMYFLAKSDFQGRIAFGIGKSNPVNAQSLIRHSSMLLYIMINKEN